MFDLLKSEEEKLAKATLEFESVIQSFIQKEFDDAEDDAEDATEDAAEDDAGVVVEDDAEVVVEDDAGVVAEDATEDATGVARVAKVLFKRGLKKFQAYNETYGTKLKILIDSIKPEQLKSSFLNNGQLIDIELFQDYAKILFKNILNLSSFKARFSYLDFFCYSFVA
jgi:hypothetical protein